jgi:putative phage-type endonuclease
VRALPALPPGSETWLAQRFGRLGGSDVAAALGLSPWCSRFTLWHRMRGEIGQTPGTESMRWGTLLEPVVLAEWARRTGTNFSRRPRVWADSWRIASPDALTTGGRVVEVKTADGNTAWEWGPDGSDDPDAVPPYYRVQVLWYLAVVPRVQPDGTLVVLLGGNDLRSYTVRAEPGEQDHIRSRALDFHRSLADDSARPRIDSADSTYLAIRELHPDIDDVDRELDPAAVEAWRVADRDLKATTARRDEARSVVADLMGDARYGCLAGERVVRRQATKGGTPYPVLVREQQQKKATAA